jgi:hypothetical protein
MGVIALQKSEPLRCIRNGVLYLDLAGECFAEIRTLKMHQKWGLYLDLFILLNLHLSSSSSSFSSSSSSVVVAHEPVHSTKIEEEEEEEEEVQSTPL